MISLVNICMMVFMESFQYLLAFLIQISMNVPATHVKMEAHVWMVLIDTDVSVLLVTWAPTVKQVSLPGGDMRYWDVPQKRITLINILHF